MDMQELLPTDFPPQLREIPQPPEKLWLRGSLPPAGTKLLAVVGSRDLSRYGREACEYLIAGLAGYPISIISGLALGADACAHRAALRAALHTIAVPGSGLSDSVIYPRSNLGLAREILAAGSALLSEHPPDYRAMPHDFPSRNRIMVGLADAVLMIEAGGKSGTLITARMAGDYNRELLCVPHRIGDPHGEGAATFLRIGATLVREPSHILQALSLELQAGPAVDIVLEESEQIIFDLLAEAQPRDELLRACTLPMHETLSLLGVMELKGIIKEEFGLWRRI